MGNQSPTVLGERSELLHRTTKLLTLVWREALHQLRALSRAFRLNPAEALTGFYAAAQLDISPAPAAIEAGEWGLEQLARAALSPELPDRWQAWCGDDDALLDAARLQCWVPQLNRVPGATHHPRALLAAAAALR